MAGPNDFNVAIIKEFRENAGKVGGPFEGSSMLLLHSTGAKSGEARINPVVYNDLGERWAIFASYAGGPRNPDWYHNLVAHPEASIEVGTETIDVVARQVEGEERTAIWEPWKVTVPTFALDYIGFKAIAVIEVRNEHFLVTSQPDFVHQNWIDDNAALIADINAGYGRAVDLGFEHRDIHDKKPLRL